MILKGRKSFFPNAWKLYHRNLNIAHACKATYNSRMADEHTDERNIDDILASIDSMLREVHPQKTNERKDAIQHAAAKSKKELNLTSTLPTITEESDDRATSIESDIASVLIEEEDDDEGDQDVVTAKPRILLTESLLEPSVQEALPLWIEATEPTETAPNIPAKENVTVDNVANTDAEDEEVSPLLEIAEDSSDEHHRTDTNVQPDPALNASAENTTPEDNDNTEEKNQTQESDTLENQVEDTSEEVANDDNITFDVSETLAVDTVYKPEAFTPAEEVENTELVEGMSSSDDEEEQIIAEKVTTTADATQTPSLDNERIEGLVDAVSNDIANQLQEQFQMALRNLVRDSIHKHLEESGLTKPDTSKHTE